MPKRLDLTPEEKLARKREQNRLRNLRFRERHPEKGKEMRQKRAGYLKDYQKKWYQANRERLLEKQKQFYQDNREHVLAYQADYQKRNRQRVTERTLAWFRKRMEDPEYAARRSKVCCAYTKRMRETDPVFRMTDNLKRRLREVVSKCATAKNGRSVVLIGCSALALRMHLESLFESWMTWDNYGFGDGKWVVDHIRPCASFDLTKPEDQMACFHYTNLRPLCWRKNMEKSDTVV